MNKHIISSVYPLKFPGIYQFAIGYNHWCEFILTYTFSNKRKTYRAKLDKIFFSPNPNAFTFYKRKRREAFNKILYSVVVIQGF